MEAKGNTTEINLEANFLIQNDTIRVKHEILGIIVKYKYKIVEADCSAWNHNKKTGLIVFSVEELDAAKKYPGKIFFEKKEQSIKLITLLDSIDGKYKINYDISEFKEY